MPPRSHLLETLFPKGIPGLWADMPTHFNARGQIDWPRMEAHFRFVQSHVHGLVVAGVAGQGERLDASQLNELVGWASQRCRPGVDFLLLGTAGKAHPTAATPSNGRIIDASDDHLQEALAGAMPVGVHLGPSDEDETAWPAKIARMAQQHENLLYVLDATEKDQLASQPALPQGVIRFQGCDHFYAASLASTGGIYHGLMLATAALFPQRMANIVLLPALGRWDEAKKLSDELANFIRQAQEITTDYTSQGHIELCDANLATCKAVDHHMAYHARAGQALAPLLRPGVMLPEPFVIAIGQLLQQHQLMPPTGYLDTATP